jgi:hypothetical protein
MSDKRTEKEMSMQSMKNKALAFGLTVTMAVGLLPTAAMAGDSYESYSAYTIEVGETIDLYGSFGLSDWESADTSHVLLDGTSSICPDYVLATGVTPTEEGEYVAVRHSYSVRVGDTWSDERVEEIFWIVVTDDPSTAPWGALTLAPGETIVLSGSAGFSDWESQDSSIARLDGTKDTAGNTNISPDQTTVTGVTPGVVNVVRSYFEQGVQKAEVFEITVVDKATAEPETPAEPEISVEPETPAEPETPEGIDDAYTYTLKVGQTIDLYGSFGLSDWESADSSHVLLDGTTSISPDYVIATGVNPTEEGEYVAVRHSYSVREGKTWSSERIEEIFWIVVTDDPSTAPVGSLTLAPGERIVLSASAGYSDWASEDSSIARLDGTKDTAGNINISPDQTTVTGVAPGTVDVVRTYFEQGQLKEEVFHIIVVE